MATTIASSVGTSMSAATGRPGQSHLVYGANNGKWYLFYLTSTNVLSLAYSSDFASWSTSGTTLTLAHVHASEGRNLGINYTNLASTDVVHLAIGYNLSSTGGTGCSANHARLTLGPTAWTVSNVEANISTYGSATYAATGAATILAVNGSSGIVTDVGGSLYTAAGQGNMAAVRSSNADSGTSWTAGYGSVVNIYQVNNAVSSSGLANLGSGNLLYVTDNNSTSGSFTNLFWSKWTSSWSSQASPLAANVTATSTNQWGMVAVTTTDVHLVALSNNSNAFVHRRFNGTAWAAGQSIPALTLHANSGLFLATDGTNAWLFAIDSSNNIQYIKWTAATPAWDAAWTQLDAGGSAARTYLSGFQSVVSGTIGLVWTQANGSNFDIVGTTLVLGGGASTSTFASTLGAATLASGAGFSTSSSFAATLGDVTLSSAGLSTPLAATFAVTTGAATLATVGQFDTPSTFAATPGAATLAASSAFATATAFAAIPSETTLSSSANSAPPGAQGSFAATTDATTLAIVASFATAGTLAASVGLATLASVAAFSSPSTFAVTTDSATLESVATSIPLAATFAATTDGATLAVAAIFATTTTFAATSDATILAASATFVPLAATFAATTGTATLESASIFATTAIYAATLGGSTLAGATTFATSSSFGASSGDAILESTGSFSLGAPSDAAFAAILDESAFAALGAWSGTGAETLECSATSTPNTWTLASGATKQVAVSDADDDLTSYINSGTSSGTQQQFTLGDPSAILPGDAITSVTIRARCMRGGTQNANYVVTAVLGSDTTAGATQTSTASWATTTDVVARPGGGSWTYADLQALEVRIQNSQNRDVRCTTLAVDVSFTRAAPSIGVFASTPGAATLSSSATSVAIESTFAASPDAATLESSASFSSASTFVATVGSTTLVSSSTFATPSSFTATTGVAGLSSEATSVPLAATFATTTGDTTLASSALFASPSSFAATLGPESLVSTATYAAPGVQVSFAETLGSASLSVVADHSAPRACPSAMLMIT